jgi:hypothetical protein
MAINFPDSPNNNDTITIQGVTWVWNGTYWKRIVGGVTDVIPSLTVDNDLTVGGNVDASGTITTNGASVATTGKAIAMAMVFGG